MCNLIDLQLRRSGFTATSRVEMGSIDCPQILYYAYVRSRCACAGFVHAPPYPAFEDKFASIQTESPLVSFKKKIIHVSIFGKIYLANCKCNTDTFCRTIGLEKKDLCEKVESIIIL